MTWTILDIVTRQTPMETDLRPAFTEIIQPDILSPPQNGWILCGKLVVDGVPCGPMMLNTHLSTSGYCFVFLLSNPDCQDLRS